LLKLEKKNLTQECRDFQTEDNIRYDKNYNNWIPDNTGLLKF
jgi:hypothetical protein